MALKMINLVALDEEATFEFRCFSFKTWMDALWGTSPNGHENESNTDEDEVNILNLKSLKRVNMQDPSAKLELILSDKRRLDSWIQNYKVQCQKTFEKDPVKMKIFREAASRLKMELDHSDFDEGDLRIGRRKAIEEIDVMLLNISGL